MIERNWRVDIPHEVYWYRPEATVACEWLWEMGFAQYVEFEIDLRDDTTAFFFVDQELAARFRLQFG